MPLHVPSPSHPQYPSRLAATSWDLAESRVAVVGFSGTKDNHRLLPAAVSQSEPAGAAELSATDGKMLALLLRTERCVCLRPQVTECGMNLQLHVHTVCGGCLGCHSLRRFMTHVVSELHWVWSCVALRPRPAHSWIIALNTVSYARPHQIEVPGVHVLVAAGRQGRVAGAAG